MAAVRGSAGLRREWLLSQREAVLQARTTQNVVVAELSAMQGRIESYMDKSRQSPGQTAALQAGNETLATLAAQMQSLQALELSEARVQLELEAQRQAEAAFHRQVHERLMVEWPTEGGRLETPRPVRLPFTR